jgi:hypothetical protein
MRTRLLTAALTLAALAAPSVARADHRELVQVSRGATAGNSTDYATYGGISADGSKVWFSTPDALVPEDADGQSDVYERSDDGKLTLISVPEDGAPGGSGPAGFIKASADGSTVVFQTDDDMTTDDGDGSGDWFARRDGHTYLVTKPDPNAFLFLHANPLTGYITPDGTHIFFATLEDLGPGDSNFQVDLYEWRLSDQLARPVSVGTDDQTHGGSGINVVAVANDSGSRAFFETRDALVPEDTDSNTDVYMRENGQTTLVTKTTSATPMDMTLRQISTDGQHVFFQTYEPLVAEDTDTERDVYEVQPGGESQLVSAGTQTGVSSDADFQRCSPDGTHVWFTTYEQLVPEDTDSNSDIYMRTGGQTTLESVGPTGGNDGFDDIVFSGLGPDGTRMYFTTHETLTADDTDFSVDIFERHDGQTRRVSVAGEPYDNGSLSIVAPDMNFAWASPDGSRIIFQSQDPVFAGDTDFNDDLYEWFDGKTGVLTGPGTQNVDAIWGGASTDGTRVVFTSTEQLTAFDTDDQADVFESRINKSPVLTAGAARTVVAGDPAEPADPGAAINDPDTDTFTGATVTLSGTRDEGESLGFADQSGISGALSGDKHTLTLTGSASRADYQAALRSVTYGGAATPGERTVRSTVTDGFDTSNTAVQTVNVKEAPPSAASSGSGGSTPPPAKPELKVSTVETGTVHDDRIDISCGASGASVERCSVEAATGDTAARLIPIGSGTRDGAGVVHVKLSPAGVRHLRARRRASQVLLHVVASVSGSQRLYARERVRVLLPGTTIRLAPVRRARLNWAAHDLRGARVVRCEARTLSRARSVCAYLRQRGLRAKLVPVRDRRISPRRAVLRYVR